MKILYRSDKPGSGKSHAMCEYVTKATKLGERFLIVQPSTDLLDQTFANLNDPTFKVIHNKNVVRGGIGSEYRKAINSDVPVILLTHESFKNNTQVAGRGSLNLIVDENLGLNEYSELTLGSTAGIWKEYLEAKAFKLSDDSVEIVSKPGYISTVSQLASGKIVDDSVTSKVKDFFNKVVSSDWCVVVDRVHWAKFQSGESKWFAYNAWMLPDFLKPFKSVTMLGADFENSLIYQVWSAFGVEFEENKQIIPKFPDFNPVAMKQVEISYFAEAWTSGMLKNMSGIKTVTESLARHISGPHLFVVNKKYEDEYDIPEGQLISTSSHGMNSYMVFNQMVYLPAMNMMPGWYKNTGETFKLSSDDLACAFTYDVMIQSVCRLAFRDRNYTGSTKIIVPTKNMAEYLSEYLPGSTVKALDLGIWDLDTSRPSRKDVLKTEKLTNAERQKKSRELKKELETKAKEFASTMKFFNSDLIKMTVFLDKKSALGDIQVFNNWDEFLDFYSSAYENKYELKEQNMLLSGTVFDPMLSDETSRGKENVLYSWAIQMDIDDGDVSLQEVSNMFSDIKHVVCNSFSNGKGGKTRGHLFIPLLKPVDLETYQSIAGVIINRFRKFGYFVRTGLKDTKTQGQLDSGLDFSKKRATDLFYLPCQSERPGYSEWIANWDVPVLDPISWIPYFSIQVDIQLESKVMNIASCVSGSQRGKDIAKDMWIKAQSGTQAIRGIVGFLHVGGHSSDDIETWFHEVRTLRTSHKDHTPHLKYWTNKIRNNSFKIF